VCLRWGRGPGQSEKRPRRSAAKDHEKPDGPRMHTIVSVHSTGSRNVARASSPCGSRPGWPCHDPRELDSEQTKPESATIQSGFVNMSDPRYWDPAYAEAYALAERIVGWFMGWGKRTKPESPRNEKACKNISVAGSRWSVVDGWTTWCVAWWWSACGQLLGRENKLQVGPKTEHRKSPTEKRTKPESLRKEGAYKNMLVTGSRWSVIGGCSTWRGAWWWSACGQLLGLGNKLQVGPKTEIRGWLGVASSFLLELFRKGLVNAPASTPLQLRPRNALCNAPFDRPDAAQTTGVDNPGTGAATAMQA
jgi:hypothetical protein